MNATVIYAISARGWDHFYHCDVWLAYDPVPCFEPAIEYERKLAEYWQEQPSIIVERKLVWLH